MIFACTQENLAQGLGLVGHIAGKNANLPILGNVLMKTDGGNLRLSTTNLEMAVSVLIRGRVEQPGEFTVPAKLLMEYVALLPNGKIELIVDGDALEIKTEGNTTKMKGMAAAEYPLLPKLATEEPYKLEAGALRQAISQVAFAVSSSDSRPELSGVSCYFHGLGGPNTLVMAATDSYRLSERVITLQGGNTKEQKCIVPARAIQEVARILSAYKDEMATPEEASWSMTDSQFVLTFGNVELVSRLIEGAFPDYRQIIPTQFRTAFTVTRGELQKAFKAASLFSKQGLFDVHVAVENGALKISSSDTGTGAHTTTIALAESVEPNKVTLNYRYVSDGLSAMGTDTVRFQMIDGMNPVVITPANGEGFQYIVMPIRQ